jgi:hypothetical protein
VFGALPALRPEGDPLSPTARARAGILLRDPLCWSCTTMYDLDRLCTDAAGLLVPEGRLKSAWRSMCSTDSGGLELRSSIAAIHAPSASLWSFMTQTRVQFRAAAAAASTSGHSGAIHAAAAGAPARSPRVARALCAEGAGTRAALSCGVQRVSRCTQKVELVAQHSGRSL